ncbi:MAG: hypothetical protein ABSF13_07205 [Smithella sp.]
MKIKGVREMKYRFLVLIFLIILSLSLASCTSIPALLSSENSITAFNIVSPVAATGVIDESTHTIAITVPYGTDVTALVATFTTTGVTVYANSFVQQSGITTNNFTNSVVYTVWSADNHLQDYTVTVTVASLSAKAITAFTFPTSTATTINEVTHTITVIVLLGTDLTTLVPTITHTGASINPVSGVAQDFTSPVTYTVTAADSTTQDYIVIAVENRIMFFSSNWGETLSPQTGSIRITNDINSLADEAIATPRIITGSNVNLPNPRYDSLAVDKYRNMIYVSDNDTNNIIVYHNAKTATGNIAPNRTITISGSSDINGIAIDYSHDRLYVAGSGSVYIINNASTQTGTITADFVLTLSSQVLFIDVQNDRLYAANLGTDVYVYDNASTLTTGATQNRIITLTGISAYTVWVDAGTNKLYVGSRNASAGEYNLFIFNNASTLSVTYNPDTDSTARIALANLVNVMVDNQDRLYMWADSATSVVIYNNASTLSGNVTASPDKTIYGVVRNGYGMGYLVY